MTDIPKELDATNVFLGAAAEASGSGRLKSLAKMATGGSGMLFATVHLAHSCINPLFGIPLLGYSVYKTFQGSIEMMEHDECDDD